nr:hypothetical protein [Deltaproteobacteria bacterium]
MSGAAATMGMPMMAMGMFELAHDREVGGLEEQQRGDEPELPVGDVLPARVLDEHRPELHVEVLGVAVVGAVQRAVREGQRHVDDRGEPKREEQEPDPAHERGLRRGGHR